MTDDNSAVENTRLPGRTTTTTRQSKRVVQWAQVRGPTAGPEKRLALHSRSVLAPAFRLSLERRVFLRQPRLPWSTAQRYTSPFQLETRQARHNNPQTAPFALLTVAAPPPAPHGHALEAGTATRGIKPGP